MDFPLLVSVDCGGFLPAVPRTEPGDNDFNSLVGLRGLAKATVWGSCRDRHHNCCNHCSPCIEPLMGSQHAGGENQQLGLLFAPGLTCPEYILICFEKGTLPSVYFDKLWTGNRAQRMLWFAPSGTVAEHMEIKDPYVAMVFCPICSPILQSCEWSVSSIYLLRTWFLYRYLPFVQIYAIHPWNP